PFPNRGPSLQRSSSIAPRHRRYSGGVEVEYGGEKAQRRGHLARDLGLLASRPPRARTLSRAVMAGSGGATSCAATLSTNAAEERSRGGDSSLRRPGGAEEEVRPPAVAARGESVVAGQEEAQGRCSEGGAVNGPGDAREEGRSQFDAHGIESRRRRPSSLLVSLSITSRRPHIQDLYTTKVLIGYGSTCIVEFVYNQGSLNISSAPLNNP
ncbi:unnamed protein product, partial [Urochloa humidicola]